MSRGISKKHTSEPHKPKKAVLDGTILIVDDNEMNHEILSAILSPSYNIISAHDGLKALKILKSDTEDITAIILDLSMPVMDGFDFLKRVSDSKKFKTLPIIVTTGFDDTESEKRALMMGAWDFISKPYDADIIRFRLKNAILRSQLSAMQQLKYLAEFDTLTEIYNKSRFFDSTRELLDRYPDTTFSFFRFDINRFNLINSFFGLSEGDRLLKHIGKTIEGYSKQYEYSTYGRIEGDVFGLCLPISSSEEIYSVIQFFKSNLSKYKIKYDIVPTFGVCIIEDHSLSVNNIFDKATLASKQCKGNYITSYAVYNHEMSKIQEAEQEIINEMSAALEQGQFSVYLQPKFNLQKQAFEGGEALVRWIHPTKGVIMPGSFIPLFEKNGFISKLDHYIWEAVCKLLHGWIKKGFKIDPVSVNVSRVNLYDPDFVDSLCALTEKYGIPNSMLNLELTESVYTDNSEIITDTIERLHERRFVVMMDDFGSGYSSLNALKDIDTDVLKIDMRFLANTNYPDRSRSIVSAVIWMAQKLGVPTIAEGVETDEQLEFLQSIGCEYAQGYLFARPLPVKEYELLTGLVRC